MILAGKTGTAEIKASIEDTSGTELGWFCVFTTEKTEEKPVLLISMTEDVKERGGSGYVVEKSKTVLENSVVFWNGRVMKAQMVKSDIALFDILGYVRRESKWNIQKK